MIDPAILARLRNAVRDIPDFPKPGILFRDITPILAQPALFQSAIDAMAATLEGRGVERLIAIDARGFLFGAALAYHLGLGLVPVRKRGKLPFQTESASYALEYGVATVEMHRDALAPGMRVALVDDLLATGGTARAAIDLARRLGATVTDALFLIELQALDGRRTLPDDIRVETLIQY